MKPPTSEKLNQTRFHTALSGFLALLMVYSSSGCKTPLYTPAKARTQEEAASTHLAVLSVARWDARKVELQPNFELKAEDALAKVIPNTLSLEEKVINALSAKIKVALPGSSFSSTELTSVSRAQSLTNAGGVTTVIGTNGIPETTLSNATGAGAGVATLNQRSNTQSSSAGDVSNLNFLPGPQGSNVAVSLPGAGVLSNTPQKDAMLLYWAAAALYQEVKLINHYVEDAAIAANYIPYLVRLQVSIMPRKRDLPYDAYTILSFFPGKFDPTAERDSHTPAIMKERPEQDAASEGVKVLPLLVTDNLEAALHSRSVENMRQLALALSGVVQGVGVGADLQKVNDELRTVLGYDFNSTFSVGRISDNSLQCRFGALNQAAARFAMIPQAHNVTLLLLVPRSKAQEREPVTQDMRVIAKTELVHAQTGEPLPSEISKDEYHLKAAQILRKNGFNPKDDGTNISRILGAFASNNYGKFTNLLVGIASRKATTYYEAVWIDFCKLRNSSQLGSLEFQILPALPKLEPGLANQMADWQSIAAVDNGKTLSTSLYWLDNIQATNLGAFLKCTGGLPDGKDKTLFLPVLAWEVQNQGRLVNLAFPSPASLGFTNATGATTVKAAALTLFSLDSKKSFRDSLSLDYRLDRLVAKEEKPAEKAGFDFAVPATVVNAQRMPTNGIEGAINVVISEKTAAARIILTVEKADVRGVLPADRVKQSGLGWELATNGTYTIQMVNLNSLEAVQISTRDTSSKAAPAIRTVRVQFNEK